MKIKGKKSFKLNFLWDCYQNVIKNGIENVIKNGIENVIENNNENNNEIKYPWTVLMLEYTNGRPNESDRKT